MPAPPHRIDTNILLRIARRDDPDHAVVDTALARLAEAGAALYYTHQNIAEFWNVATGPFIISLLTASPAFALIW